MIPFNIVATHSKEPTFTQGLYFDPLTSCLFESSGLYSKSFISKTCKTNSKSNSNRVNIPKTYFAEGLAFKDNHIFVCTYKEQTGLIYDTNLKLVGSWSYSGPGWGLTWTGSHFVMSNGTHELKFYNSNFEYVKSLFTTVSGLNCLAYNKGFIFANIFPTNQIGIFNSSDGTVHGIVDCSSLEREARQSLSSLYDQHEPVCNGISFTERGTLLVTGKGWTKLFELELLV